MPEMSQTKKSWRAGRTGGIKFYLILAAKVNVKLTDFHTSLVREGFLALPPMGQLTLLAESISDSPSDRIGLGRIRSFDRVDRFGGGE